MARPAKPFVPPTIYWRGKCAWINWHEQGKRHRASLGCITPDKAAAICAAKENELREQAKARAIETRYDVKILSTAPTLRAFIEDDYIPSLEAGKPKGMTAKYSLARVVAELGHIPLDKLKPIDVERYKTKRLKSAKSATVAKEVRMLKAAMRRAMLLQAIEKNPIELIKPPSVQESKAIDFFTSEQLAQIYANADRYAAVWKFAVNTGLRRKELAKARRSDVQVTAGNEKVLKVESIESEERDDLGRSTEHLTNKSRKVRFVPLNAAALEALDQLGEDKLVPLSAKGLDKAWDRVRRRTGLLGGIHWLRHTFASQLVMKGAALRTVQNLMGHATIAVTERYAHLAPGQTTEAVKLISLYVTEMPGFLSQLLSQRIALSSKYLKVQAGEVPERPKGLPC